MDNQKNNFYTIDDDLIPRALNHHQWYKNYFSDYPTNRKAIFPFLF
ncbi:MAG: hypothetical protein EVA44_02745 [Flavobacteriales bacterium]|nr:MAG: hypothetical protein EVA44_02745 [Flavobacteriales bacterium]